MNLDQLKGLQNKFSPEGMLNGMLDKATPKVVETFKQMEQSTEDGGLLQDGEDKIAMAIVVVNGEVKVNIVPLTASPNGMVMGKPIKSSDLKGLLELFK